MTPHKCGNCHKEECNDCGTWTVTYSEHDLGSRGGFFVRPTKHLADRSAELMRQCGYGEVVVKKFSNY